MNRWVAILLLGGLLFPAAAEPPDIEYIYPAGGQRGTVVPVRVVVIIFRAGSVRDARAGGAVQIHRAPRGHHVVRGPLIFQPLSQRGEDYPKISQRNHLAANAPLGDRYWRCWTSQGATRALRFVVGNLPEVMEEEIDGRRCRRRLLCPYRQWPHLPTRGCRRLDPRSQGRRCHRVRCRRQAVWLAGESG